MAGLGGEGSPDSPLDRLLAQCRPVQLDAVMDIVFDASAVLTFWAPRPGRMPGALLGGQGTYWGALGAYWGAADSPRMDVEQAACTHVHQSSNTAPLLIAAVA